MKEHRIFNWVGGDPIEVDAAAAGTIATHGPLLYITQSAGSMRLQHTITPAQARQMAQSLIDTAAEAEAIAVDNLKAGWAEKKLFEETP